MAAHKLVLIRHGESNWNQENRFCGWFDADLSETGVKEATRGGQALKGEGEPYSCYTVISLKYSWLRHNQWHGYDCVTAATPQDQWVTCQSDAFTTCGSVSGCVAVKSCEKCHENSRVPVTKWSSRGVSSVTAVSAAPCELFWWWELKTFFPPFLILFWFST